MVRQFIGIILLAIIWCCIFFPIVPYEAVGSNAYFQQTLIVSILGLCYALVQKHNYPVPLVISTIVSASVIYSLKSDYYYYALSYISYSELGIGTFLILTGRYGVEAFTFILSPIQKFLRSIGIKLPLPIIVALLLIPIAVFGLEIIRQN